MFITHNYEEMTPDKRPQDSDMDGEGWTFELLDHGGEYPDAMPQAIRATDPQGRQCMYVPITVEGKVVDSKGFMSDSTPGAIMKPESPKLPTPWPQNPYARKT
jgi:hypothetical protein